MTLGSWNYMCRGSLPSQVIFLRSCVCNWMVIQMTQIFILVQVGIALSLVCISVVEPKSVVGGTSQSGEGVQSHVTEKCMCARLACVYQSIRSGPLPLFVLLLLLLPFYSCKGVIQREVREGYREKCIGVFRTHSVLILYAMNRCPLLSGVETWTDLQGGHPSSLQVEGGIEN